MSFAYLQLSHFTLMTTTWFENNLAFLRDGEGAHYFKLMGAGIFDFNHDSLEVQVAVKNY